MLHHPFVDFADILAVDGRVYGSYIDAYRACRRLYTHPEDFYTDPEAESGSESANEGHEEDEQEMDDNHPLADFEALARRRPQEDFIRVDFDDSLRARELDRAYDWSAHFDHCNATPDVWDRMIAENPVAQMVTMDSSPETLNFEQRKLYDVR